MNKKSVIFLTGHKGLVGSAVHRELREKGYNKIITVDKKKLDLRDFKKTLKYFKNKKIDYMIMAAARAGGILANSHYQKNFFFENIEIQNSLLKFALKKKNKKNNIFRNFLYLSKICKKSNQRKFFADWKIRKN